MCLFNYVVMLFAALCLLGIFCTLLVTVNNAYMRVNCFQKQTTQHALPVRQVLRQFDGVSHNRTRSRATATQPIVERRSGRHVRRPAHLKDFV